MLARHGQAVDRLRRFAAGTDVFRRQSDGSTAEALQDLRPTVHAVHVRFLQGHTQAIFSYLMPSIISLCSCTLRIAATASKNFCGFTRNSASRFDSLRIRTSVERVNSVSPWRPLHRLQCLQPDRDTKVELNRRGPGL